LMINYSNPTSKNCIFVLMTDRNIDIEKVISYWVDSSDKDFKTMVTESAVNIARKYLSSLSEDMDIKRAYLFGSYAKGTQKEESDIDIAVVVGHMNDFFELQMELFRRRRRIDLRIEPHPFEEADFSENNPVAAEIMNSGIEILNVA
jgi:predicted nucleotidyltransferase